MDLSKYKQGMEKAKKHLEHEFATLQLGRASSVLVEGIDIFIPDWGMKQKLNQLANITIMDAQTIKIEPWDKGSVSHIEKGIYDSGTGLTPANQGDYVLITIPPLTTERRQEIVKYVHKLGEDTKITIRNVRHDAIKDIKKLHDDKEISDDMQKQYEGEIDDMAKEYNTTLDQEVKNKSDEVMKI